MVKRTKYLNPQTSPFSRQPEPHSGPKPSPLPSCPCCVPAPHPIATPTTMQTSCRLRRTTQRRAARFRRHVALGSRPAPKRRSASQATSGSEPVGPRRPGTARAAMLGIFTTAPPAQSHGRLRPGRWSPVSLRQGSPPSRGSAALALPTRGFSVGRVVGETARLVADACAAGVAVVKKVALPSGGANAHDVFAAGGSSICGARRGSSARVASCLLCSMATLRTAAGFIWSAMRGARRRPRRRAGCERG